MRRGELVPIRRSKLDEKRQRILVDTAIDGSRLKPTKTRTNRHVAVDEETMDMLLRHCDRMDERALAFGVDVDRDAFVFSHEPDCSVPMSPGYVTHQVALLKEHLGIADKRPATIELEDEALRLFRQPPAPRPAGRRGPAPQGGMSFREIGRQLGRTGRWVKLAVDSAIRREEAVARGVRDSFDGSILALRKFTSSELLDAGFNIAAVADRQGHSPEVLVRHYNKARRSADEQAAAHLGRVVHGASARAE
jgi:integrase